MWGICDNTVIRWRKCHGCWIYTLIDNYDGQPRYRNSRWRLGAWISWVTINLRASTEFVIVSKQRLDLALQTLQSQETKFRQHERFLSLCLVRSNMSQTDRLAMTMTMIQKMMPIQPPFHSQLLSSGCWVAGSVVFRISLLVRMLLAYCEQK